MKEQIGIREAKKSMFKMAVLKDILMTAILS